jgi:serine/threonine protein kinase
MLKLHDSDKIKLYSQGAYGCIYKPGLTCRGNLDSKKFIRKIQKENKGSKNEKRIGDIIKKIKHYKDYFAPVIDSCPIAVNSIENEEIKKCEIMNETSSNYISYKIRYVGKNTLADYLLDVYKRTPKSFLKVLFTTHMDILEEISILYSHKIIHMDLKENNIIIDETLNKPILIDFGLSFCSTDLTDSTLRDYFFIYQHYSPWCFDIHLINCIINTIITPENKLDINTTSIQKTDLEAICIKFIKDNTFLQANFTVEDLEEFKKQLFLFVAGFHGKKLKEIMDGLMTYMGTWDNYAVAVIYFSILKDNKLDSMGSKLFQEYMNLLKTILFATPDKRPSTSVSKSALLMLTQKVFKQEKIVIQDKIIKNGLDDMFVQAQHKKTALHKLNNLTQQADFYKVNAH